MTQIRVNGSDRDIDVDAETLLLWVLRDHLGLTGTKLGCGIARCGALHHHDRRRCPALLQVPFTAGRTCGAARLR